VFVAHTVARVPRAQLAPTPPRARRLGRETERQSEHLDQLARLFFNVVLNNGRREGSSEKSPGKKPARPVRLSFDGVE